MGITFNSEKELFAERERLSALSIGKNFAKSMAEWSADGFRFATKEEAEKRTELCNSCEFLKDGRCLKCGCFIAAKTKLRTSYCPIGKWGVGLTQ